MIANQAFDLVRELLRGATVRKALISHGLHDAVVVARLLSAPSGATQRDDLVQHRRAIVVLPILVRSLQAREP